MNSASPLRRSFLAALLLFAAGSGTACADGFTRLLPGHYDLETITVTDFTPGVAHTRTPTSENPVYFAALSGGFRDFGSPLLGDKGVDRKVVDRVVLKALA